MINFKEFGAWSNFEFELSDLTVITGDSESGKSVFLNTLLLLNQENTFIPFSKENIEEYREYYSKKLEFLNIFSCVYLDYSDKKDIYFIPNQRISVFSEGRLKAAADIRQYSLSFFAKILQEIRLKAQLLKLDFKFLKTNFKNISETFENFSMLSYSQQNLFLMQIIMEYAIRMNPDCYIVIEEPENGLNSMKQIEFMYNVFQCLFFGAKVIISTNSSTPLDLIWSINNIKNIIDLKKMFNFEINEDVITNLSTKEIKTYFFSEKGNIKDISTLDVTSDDEDISGWGEQQNPPKKQQK